MITFSPEIYKTTTQRCTRIEYLDVPYIGIVLVAEVESTDGDARKRFTDVPGLYLGTRNGKDEVKPLSIDQRYPVGQSAREKEFPSPVYFWD